MLLSIRDAAGRDSPGAAQQAQQKAKIGCRMQEDLPGPLAGRWGVAGGRFSFDNDSLRRMTIQKEAVALDPRP
jgi:hypothetical protein